MLARVWTASLSGVSARPVRVEVDLARGLPAFHLVGLPDGAVRESRERVTAALANSGFDLPLRRITVNLAPADEPKSGSGFDLAIALAILAADGRLAMAANGSDLAAYGELGLDGAVRPVHGTLPVAVALAAAGVDEMLVAAETAAEAALVDGVRAIPAATLRSAVDHVSGLVQVAPAKAPCGGAPERVDDDWSEVRGQVAVRRALEIAAAGGHNALLVGPPGAGKTYLARRFPSILPRLERERALEVTAIHSAWGRLPAERPLVERPPFRAPHHTVSAAALLGGGVPVRPGEVSLAHHGVLFLDELPEFRRDALEGLRQPIEEGTVAIDRVRARHRFPARFTLLAAMNPCPCGQWGEPERKCRCAPAARRRYRDRISGPLMDRIDLRIVVERVPFAALVDAAPAESSAAARERIRAARDRQRRRAGAGALNGRVAALRGAPGFDLDPAGVSLLARAHERLDLSARGHVRVLRVARTIADLAVQERIGAAHLAEAIRYRSVDPREEDLGARDTVRPGV